MKKDQILHHSPQHTSHEPHFDAGCRRCPRLAAFLDTVRDKQPEYWCRPVPAFGDAQPRLLLVGLAPGMHGANRTGRPFTGDYAGALLYSTLYKYGYASAPESVSADDGLELTGCRISNAVKCLPPDNKPTPLEIKTCNAYLQAELGAFTTRPLLLALGRIAHDAVLMALQVKAKVAPFGHGVQHVLPNGWTLFDSYHCSRYNTQTKRLTEAMFHDVFEKINVTISHGNGTSADV